MRTSFVDDDGTTRFSGTIVGPPVFLQEADPGEGANPGNGALWIDTAQSPPIMLLRDGDGTNDDGAAWLIYQRLDVRTIISNYFVAGSVGGATIADNGVQTAKIADRAVEEPKLATNAVSTAKIADLAVTAGKLAVPTSDPHVLGVIWNNGGTLKASQG